MDKVRLAFERIEVFKQWIEEELRFYQQDKKYAAHTESVSTTNREHGNLKEAKHAENLNKWYSERLVSLVDFAASLSAFQEKTTGQNQRCNSVYQPDMFQGMAFFCNLRLGHEGQCQSKVGWGEDNEQKSIISWDYLKVVREPCIEKSEEIYHPEVLSARPL